MRSWIALLAVACGGSADVTGDQPLEEGAFDIAYGEPDGSCPDAPDGIVSPPAVEVSGGPDTYLLDFDDFEVTCEVSGSDLDCAGEYVFETFPGYGLEDATFGWVTTVGAASIESAGSFTFDLATVITCEGADCAQAIQEGAPPAPCDAVWHGVATR